MKRKFTASVWHEGSILVAQCLEVDIAVKAKQTEEALRNIAEALALHFEPPGPTTVPKVATIEVEIRAA